MKKIFFGLLLTAMLLSTKTSIANASEGFFELENQIGTSARCYITSGLMENAKFSLLTLCRDILYPGGTEVFTYIAWANPLDGNRPNPIKLGELGRGKKLFTSSRPFNMIYVTKELDSRAREPSGQVVMQGGLQTIPFLNQVPNVDDIPQVPSDNELLDDNDVNPVVTEAPDVVNQSSPRNILRVIALGGILTFLAIFGVVLIIFVVSRR